MPDCALTNGFGDKSHPENRLPGFVRKLHPPFGVPFQATRKAAEQVAADLGHLGPGGFAAFEFGSLIGRTFIAAVADPKKYSGIMISWLGGPRPSLPVTTWNEIRCRDKNAPTRTGSHRADRRGDR